MSKQKIREWLKENILMTGYAPLEDIIEQYTKDQSAWVSVDDSGEKPKDGQEVLVYMANGATQSDLDTHTCKYSAKYGFERSRVTHWAPKPLPPTQIKGG